MPEKRESEYITVSGHQIGIVGLRSILQEVASLAIDIDDEKRITTQLIQRVKAHNYMPDSAKAAYGQAILREYRKFLGQEVKTEVEAGDLIIKILGPGCFRCERLTMEVRNALAKLRLAASVEHVQEPEAIAAYGLLSTPALIVNGQVLSSGRMPSREMMEQWLQEICRGEKPARRGQKKKPKLP